MPVSRAAHLRKLRQVNTKDKDKVVGKRKSSGEGKDNNNPVSASDNEADVDSCSQTDSQTESDSETAAAVEEAQFCFIEHVTDFGYAQENFTRVQVAPNGNCFYSSIALFTDPHMTEKEVREIVVAVFTSINSTAVNRFLGEDSAVYATTKQLAVDGTWATENEILAAATAFQRPIFVYRPKVQQKQRSLEYEIYRYNPFGTTTPTLSVSGSPEMPIVIVCSTPNGFHFEPLLLKRRDIVSSPLKSPMPKLRRINSPSPMKATLKQRKAAECAGAVRNLVHYYDKDQADLANYKNQVRQLEAGLQKMFDQKRTASQERAETEKKIAHLELARDKCLKQHQYDVVQLDVGENCRLINVRPVGRKRYRRFQYVPKMNTPLSCIKIQAKIGRLQIMNSVVEALAGDQAPHELANVVQEYIRFRPDLQEELCNGDNVKPLFSRRLSGPQSLDLQLQLGISNKKMRELQQFLSGVGLNVIGSAYGIEKEKMSRRPQIEMEECLLQLTEVKDGKRMEVLRPVIRAPSLIAYIKEMYHRTTERNVMLNHSSFRNRIWIAFSGDAGGGTTKITFCFGNAEKASSANNLHILAIYEGDDSAENLERVLRKYENEWPLLSTLELPKPIINRHEDESDGDNSDSDFSIAAPNTSAFRTNDTSLIDVFVYGDLKFLSALLGHAGSSATSPCIYCDVKLSEIRKPLSTIFSRPPRTWNQRKMSDWKEALSSGAHEMQKKSIKSMPIIPIADVMKVIPPVLHLALGVGTQMVNKIEEICYQRDLDLGSEEKVKKTYKLKCAEKAAAAVELDEASKQLKLAQQIVQAVKDAMQDTVKPKRKTAKECRAVVCIAERATLLGSQTVWLQCDQCKGWMHMECCMMISASDQELVQRQEHWICPRCTKQHLCHEDVLAQAEAFVDAITNEQGKLEARLESIENQVEDISEKIKMKKGGAVERFEEGLSKLGVDRQAFHGGVFIGNHIYKMIRAEGPATVTACIESSDEMQQKEKVLLQGILTSLGNIVQLMGKARFLSEEEISKLCQSCSILGKQYEELMAIYKGDKESKFMTVTPKLHLLITHVPEFAQKYKTVGIISEHGLESLHATLNGIGRRFACLRSMSKVMKAMVKEHQLASGRMRQRAVEKLIYAAQEENEQ